MNLEVEWIKDNVKFNCIEEGHILAEVRNTPDFQTDFWSYSKKFLESANAVIAHILQAGDHTKNDIWFFPVSYMYRQSLELALKSIASKHITDKDKLHNFIRDVGHNLIECFNGVKGLLINNGYDMNSYEIRWLVSFLSDISRVDEQSDMFRYPFSKKMTDFFPEQIHINLKALGINMNAAHEVLESLLTNETKTLNTDYPPKLLLEGGTYLEQSVLGWNFKAEFFPYVEGYMKVANYLRNEIKETLNTNDHFIPMCYLYRNGIELSLKRIFFEDINYDEKMLTKLYKKSHSVQKIWNLIKQDILDANKHDKTFVNAEIYIKELHKADNTSSTFRYPVDKDLNLHFSEKKTFNVTNISSFFNQLFTFLDGVDAHLSHINEANIDIQEYYRD
ncbi:hypothetical protein [Halobacillus litoralis]|uniref:hypothetical protein n=1 Tax=Halobacillus litoralis TaxID=45668 RepID=UPI001CD373FE|nr:hypothetical protein [Halobacillus litoralis]MCA1024276.1 hypothetical protein [Halobacillus litoralis]